MFHWLSLSSLVGAFDFVKLKLFSVMVNGKEATINRALDGSTYPG